VCEDERFRAYQLLASHSLWWEPGSSAWEARGRIDPSKPYIPVYYKIRIDRVTGHECTPDAPVPRPRSFMASSEGNPGWLRGTLARLLRGRSR
jgi:hypothetical protein